MQILPNNIFFKEVEQIIAEGGCVKIRVKGNSMNPFLRSDRDEVELSPFNNTELEKGIIVLFHYNDKYIMHRIIERSGNNLTIQGDGNLGNNIEKAQVADVIAVVRKIIKENGEIIDCASQQWIKKSELWTRFKPLRRILLFFWRRF